MGNQTTNKIKLQLTKRQIIIHHAFKMKIQIDQLSQFPHGLDGLKLWQAGIVLSRFIILNEEIFKDKQILELGTGVGIAGMVAKKWTSCKSVTVSDYHDNILKQCQHNCIKNGFIVDINKYLKSKDKQNENFIKVIKLDWRSISQQKRIKQNQKQQARSPNKKIQKQIRLQTDILEVQYDIIMGSDIVYFGCPVKDLYQVFKKLLKIDGQGIIIIPDRKNYAQLFLQLIQQQYFDLKKQKLDNSQYKDIALQNEQQSKKQYSLLTQIDFYAYILTKKK